MEKYHESIERRVLYKYESKAERKSHVEQMEVEGWILRSKFDIPNNVEWSKFELAAEFTKAE